MKPTTQFICFFLAVFFIVSVDFYSTAAVLFYDAVLYQQWRHAELELASSKQDWRAVQEFILVRWNVGRDDMNIAIGYNAFAATTSNTGVGVKALEYLKKQKKVKK